MVHDAPSVSSTVPAPSNAPDPTRLGASALARRIAAGEVSSLEVVEAHLARIARADPVLHALVVPRADAARREAREADARRSRGEPLGPLHGVPFSVKESLDVAGTASTFGLESRRGHVAGADEPHVARMRQAGGVLLGKTNVAQLLLYYEADNPVHGRTSNPWDRTRTPGGSSGGEAALIAAGGSPLGLGSDLGGSVRVPAAFCGLCGLKATSGRLPDLGRGSIPIGQQGVASQVGFIARHVEDLALALRIASGGPSPAAPGAALGDPGGVSLAGLRVGWYDDDGLFPATPAARRAVAEAAQALAGRGAIVTRWTPHDAATGFALFYQLVFADGFAGGKRLLAGNRLHPSMVPLWLATAVPPFLQPVVPSVLRLSGRPVMATLSRHSRRCSADVYWQRIEAAMDYRAAFARSMERAEGGPLDLVLSPPMPIAAHAHGASLELTTCGSYAILWSVLGYPAGVVPWTRVRPEEAEGRPKRYDRMHNAARAAEIGSAGLPVGVQVAGRPWQEHQVLAAMAALHAEARTRADFPATPIEVAG
jgi:fatty acid amide hydrolase